MLIIADKEQKGCKVNDTTVNNDDNLFNVTDVASELKVHRTTIDRAVRSRTIDFFKFGKSVRFSRKHINDFKSKFEVSEKTNVGEK